jgi:hypothetical protein
VFDIKRKYGGSQYKVIVVFYRSGGTPAKISLTYASLNPGRKVSITFTGVLPGGEPLCQWISFSKIVLVPRKQNKCLI